QLNWANRSGERMYGPLSSIIGITEFSGFQIRPTLFWVIMDFWITRRILRIYDNELFLFGFFIHFQFRFGFPRLDLRLRPLQLPDGHPFPLVDLLLDLLQLPVQRSYAGRNQLFPPRLHVLQPLAQPSRGCEY